MSSTGPRNTSKYRQYSRLSNPKILPSSTGSNHSIEPRNIASMEVSESIKAPNTRSTRSTRSIKARITASTQKYVEYLFFRNTFRYSQVLGASAEFWWTTRLFTPYTITPINEMETLMGVRAHIKCLRGRWWELYSRDERRLSLLACFPHSELFSVWRSRFSLWASRFFRIREFAENFSFEVGHFILSRFFLSRFFLELNWAENRIKIVFFKLFFCFRSRQKSKMCCLLYTSPSPRD